MYQCIKATCLETQKTTFAAEVLRNREETGSTAALSNER